MNLNLKGLFEGAVAKIGPVGTFVPMIARQIKKALDEMDDATVGTLAQELREGGQAQIDLADELDAARADGFADLEEVGKVALKVERWVDETEDIFTLHDEDDPAETPDQPETSPGG